MAPTTKMALAVLLATAGLVTVIGVVVVGHTGCTYTRSDRAKNDVRHVASEGVEAFKLMRGRYPTREEGLHVLVAEGLLKPNAPHGRLLDPWAREYAYRCPGLVQRKPFDVLSFGADGTVGLQKVGTLAA